MAGMVRPAVAVMASAALALLAVAVLSPGPDNIPNEIALLSKAPSRLVRYYAPLHAPLKPGSRLWLYWGEHVDHYASAKVVHTELDMQHAPEYVYKLSSQRFRGLTLECCNVLVFPPMAHGFPVFAFGGQMHTRIARFVAQGNTAVFTGGLTDALFINRYFKMHLETLETVYSPGPFTLRYHSLPPALKAAGLPAKLPQIGTQVSVFSKFSLPYGSTIIYDDLTAGTPGFAIKFCMVNNPKKGEPPFKVNPNSCPRWKRKGNPCGCGNILYLGYDFRDSQGTGWNVALRKLVNWGMRPPQPPRRQAKAAAPKAKKTPARRAKRARRVARRTRTRTRTRTARKQNKPRGEWQVEIHQGKAPAGQGYRVHVDTSKR